VAKLVASLVDNSGQTPGKTEDQEERKRLKKQHEQISKCPHNPKVGGSNPSPAISSRKLKAIARWPFLLVLQG